MRNIDGVLLVWSAGRASHMIVRLSSPLPSLLLSSPLFSTTLSSPISSLQTLGLITPSWNCVNPSRSKNTIRRRLSWMPQLDTLLCLSLHPVPSPLVLLKMIHWWSRRSCVKSSHSLTGGKVGLSGALTLPPLLLQPSRSWRTVWRLRRGRSWRRRPKSPRRNSSRRRGRGRQRSSCRPCVASPRPRGRSWTLTPSWRFVQSSPLI